LTQVVKRNGRKEFYNEDKVRRSLEAAVENAGYNLDNKRQFVDKTVRNVSRNVKIMSEVPSEQINNIIERNIIQEEKVSGDSGIKAAWDRN
jgi:transcriptional regulator NrdR family protein